MLEPMQFDVKNCPNAFCQLHSNKNIFVSMEMIYIYKLLCCGMTDMSFHFLAMRYACSAWVLFLSQWKPSGVI